MDSHPTSHDSSAAPASGAELLLHVARGLAMGTADSVPGVSGGTVALVLGIYERLLAAIGNAARAVVALVRADLPQVRTRLRDVEWRLILPLGLGIGVALVVASAVIPDLLERFPSQARALFLGMVAASVIIPWRRIGRPSTVDVAVAAVAGLVAFVATGIPPGEIADPSMIQIFGAAAIAICAMILPGVSGSYLLVVLGMYATTLEAVHWRDLTYIAVFGLGAAVGLGAFSMVLNRLLRTHHDRTMAALVGLMAGSLRALWPWQGSDRSFESPPDGRSAAIVIALVVAGFAAIRLLERSSRTVDTVAPANHPHRL